MAQGLSHSPSNGCDCAILSLNWQSHSCQQRSNTTSLTDWCGNYKTKDVCVNIPITLRTTCKAELQHFHYFKSQAIKGITISPKAINPSLFPQLSTLKSKWEECFGECLGILYPWKKKSWEKKNRPPKITVFSAMQWQLCVWHKKNTKTNFAEEKKGSIINCWCCNTGIITPYSIISDSGFCRHCPLVLLHWAIEAVSHLNNVGDGGGISDKREGFYHLFSSRSHRKWLILVKVGYKRWLLFLTRLWLSIAVEEIGFMAVWLSSLTSWEWAYKEFA